jgi:CRISPR system Cascade subunit CasA
VRRLHLLTLTLACACVRYAPRPLDLEAAPSAFQGRSLSDPALLAALDSLGIHEAADHRPAPGVHPSVAWDDWSLAWAAWIMRPERARLAAEVRAAEVGVVAAGGRPAPGIQGGVEGTFSGRDGTSPWAVALSGLFRFEFGGKRDARIARAEASVLVARARAELAGWSFRLQVRRRLQELQTADSRVSDGTWLVHQANAVVAGYERRYHDGVVGAVEVARVRGDRDMVQAELLAARRNAAEAEARLRQESGLTEPLRTPRIRRGPNADCVAGTPAALDSLSRLSLTHRLELAVALAEYQESEADVRLTAAQSWPDLELGPGLLFDHGAGKWTTGFGLPSIPAGYRGPLLQAMARRSVQAARVAEVQTAVLAEVDAAIRRCEAAQTDLRGLDSLRQGAVERLRAARDARDRGETDEVPVNRASLEVLRSMWIMTEVSARRTQAQYDLEAAIGVWNREPVTESEDSRE